MVHKHSYLFRGIDTEGDIYNLFKIVDKLEQRISTLEKAESKKEELKQLAFPFPEEEEKEFLNFRVINSK